MLKREQWQWLADNHDKVKMWCGNAFWIFFWVYLGLLLNMMFEKGKASIPFKEPTDFVSQFACRETIKKNNLGQTTGWVGSAKPEYRKDANFLILEHYDTGMHDISFLREHPECTGAILADEEKNPNPWVEILYDKTQKMNVYRIVQISTALRR